MDRVGKSFDFVIYILDSGYILSFAYRLWSNLS